jgi:hypothetical protein
MGGATTAPRLPENYYGQFVCAAQRGGMAAVIETRQYQERIAANLANRGRLLAVDPAEYIATMSRWRDWFAAGAAYPVMGVSPSELASISTPTIVIPGNDLTHSCSSGLAAQQSIPGAELHRLPIADTDRDIIPYEEWKSYEPEIARAFIEFMRRIHSDNRLIAS